MRPWQINAPNNNAMHAKSGLRVVLEWKIYRPDSVIAAVITLKRVVGATSITCKELET